MKYDELPPPYSLTPHETFRLLVVSELLKDIDSRNKVILGYGRLILKIAWDVKKMFSSRTILDFDDLAQEGFLAFIEKLSQLKIKTLTWTPETNQYFVSNTYRHIKSVLCGKCLSSIPVIHLPERPRGRRGKERRSSVRRKISGDSYLLQGIGEKEEKTLADFLSYSTNNERPVEIFLSGTRGSKRATSILDALATTDDESEKKQFFEELFRTEILSSSLLSGFEKEVLKKRVLEKKSIPEIVEDFGLPRSRQGLGRITSLIKESLRKLSNGKVY